MKKVIVFLQHFPRWALILSILALDHISGAIYSMFYAANNPINSIKMSTSEKIVLIGLFGPVVETFVFQTAIITFVVKISKSNILAVLLSSFAFAFAHNYSIAYMSKAFATGIIYSLLYLSSKKYYASICVLITHSMYNITGFILYEVLPKINF